MIHKHIIKIKYNKLRTLDRKPKPNSLIYKNVGSYLCPIFFCTYEMKYLKPLIFFFLST